tara:strand:- start:94 stop:441 length:348 start_codon:yes stop_codon:yes gene_type:complete
MRDDLNQLFNNALSFVMPVLLKSLPTLHFLISFFLGALTLAFLLRIILTWYPKIDLRNGLWPIIFLPTEPALIATRKIFSPIGGVDVTPIIWVGLLSLFRELFLGQQGLLTQIIY